MMKFYTLVIFTYFSIQIVNGQKYFTGIPEGRDTLYDVTNKKVTLTTANYRDIGGKASLKQYAPYPGNQGEYGTCAAWATTYCARTILESIANDETDKTIITQNAFSPGFVYRLASENKDCWGSQTTECANQMYLYGVPTLNQFNEQCPIDIPSEVFELAKDNKIKSFAKLWDDTRYYEQASAKTKIELVKKSINEKYPVVISIICPNSFQSPSNDLWIPTEELNSDINHKHGRHAICVVGYDDEKYGGAFEIQNSWGTNWGNEGYVWIKYADFAKFVYQAIEIIGFENYLHEETDFSGGLKVLLSDGEYIEATYQENGVYKLNKSLSSGERFRLYLNSSSPTYLYSINIGSKGEIGKIFPYSEEISPILNYKNNDVPIPSEDKHMRLDGVSGKEYLCLIYSKKSVDIDNVIFNLSTQNKNNSLYQKFEVCFGNSLIPLNEINYNTDSNDVRFSATSNSQDVLVIIIEIDHIE